MNFTTIVTASEVEVGDIVLTDGKRPLPVTAVEAAPRPGWLWIHLADPSDPFGDPLELRPGWQVTRTHRAPQTPVSDRERVEQIAAELGMGAHPAPCRFPAGPVCTC